MKKNNFIYEQYKKNTIFANLLENRNCIEGFGVDCNSILLSYSGLTKIF